VDNKRSLAVTCLLWDRSQRIYRITTDMR
jgi:hypothetical protein